MNKKYLIITMAAAVAVGGLTLFNARAAERAGGGLRGGAILQRVAGRLNLSASQKAEFKAGLKARKDSLTKLFTQLHEARQGLREAVRAKDATEAAVRAASAKVAAVEADLAVERLELQRKIAPILTGDQREQLAELEARIDNFVTDAIGRIGQRLAE